MWVSISRRSRELAGEIMVLRAAGGRPGAIAAMRVPLQADIDEAVAACKAQIAQRNVERAHQPIAFGSQVARPGQLNSAVIAMHCTTMNGTTPR